MILFFGICFFKVVRIALEVARKIAACNDALSDFF